MLNLSKILVRHLLPTGALVDETIQK